MVYFFDILLCISLMTSEIEHLIIYSLPTCISSLLTHSNLFHFSIMLSIFISLIFLDASFCQINVLQISFPACGMQGNYIFDNKKFPKCMYELKTCLVTYRYFFNLPLSWFPTIFLNKTLSCRVGELCDIMYTEDADKITLKAIWNIWR